MKKISSYSKKIIICFSIITMISITINTCGFNSVRVISLQSDEEKGKLIMENYNLKNTLENILPEEGKQIFEEENRGYYNENIKIETFPLRKVINNGVYVGFKKIYNNPQYSRPIYISEWRDFWFRNWAYLPQKLSEASHKIFIYPIGASSAFDFTGSLGFYEQVSYDAHRYINILIYNFDVEHIKEYNNQIALIGKPKRKGAEVISILQDSLLSKDEKEKEFIFQLCTKGGYLIDYIYGGVINYQYLKGLIEKNSVSSRLPQEEDYIDIENDNKSLNELITENLQLNKELSYYTPLEESLLITEDSCKSISNSIEIKDNYIKEASDKGEKINFTIKYNNSGYKRPIYDPVWKENYQLGWAYMPTKLCQYMHNLFIIPKDKEKEKNFMGSLGFSEKYKRLKKDELGLLLYNFNIKKIVKFEDRMILVGIPCKRGASIISIKDKDLTKGMNYIFQMMTPDNEEIDMKYLY